MQTDGVGPFRVLTLNTALDKDGNERPDALMFDATNLQGSKKYKFSIQGVNAHGPGKKLFSEFISPKPGVPEKIKERPAVGDVTSRSCKIEWETPLDGGSPILGYRIYIRH